MNAVPHDRQQQQFERRLRLQEDSSVQFNLQLAELTVKASELPAEIRVAVKEGVTQAITDPKVHAIMWASMVQQAQRGAVENTGRWIWKTIWSVASRWLLVCLILLFILKSAGLEAAIKFFSMLGAK